MKIKVKLLQGDEYIIEVFEDQPVSGLKAAISEKANGIAIERQKLVYKGQTLHDASPLSRYGLEEGCKVYLIVQSSNLTSSARDNQMDQAASSSLQSGQNQLRPETAASIQLNPKQIEFDNLLRSKLSRHYNEGVLDKILANIHKKIMADINSSSLDDLERLAKQRLNVGSK